jgi:hypothetical protein
MRSPLLASSHSRRIKNRGAEPTVQKALGSKRMPERVGMDTPDTGSFSYEGECQLHAPMQRRCSSLSNEEAIAFLPVLLEHPPSPAQISAKVIPQWL